LLLLEGEFLGLLDERQLGPAIHDLGFVELAVFGQEVAGEAELEVVGEDLRDGLREGRGEDGGNLCGGQPEANVDGVGAVGRQADLV
jgi:hypothetical protein